MSAQFHRYRIAGEAPLTCPEMICATACSALLRISSPATVLTLTTGAEVSTVKFALWLVLFLPDR
ncbi:hypothetical protein FA041_04265 [Escherichia coli]|nr:hypothetical protein [Escherichia coli]